MEFGPFGLRQGPVALGTGLEAIDVPHLQKHPWLPSPAIVLAVQEVIEKAELKVTAVIGVKMRPMFDAVSFEPFLLRCGPHEAFKIAARM